MVKDFEILPHTADLKIRVYGATRQELFGNALSGMFHAINPQTKNCKRVDDRIQCPKLDCIRTLDVAAPDLDALLVDFLSDALYFSDVHNEAYFDVEIIEMDDKKIHARILGVEVQGFQIEIKAVTYHGLHIEQKDGLWQVDIVFDI